MFSLAMLLGILAHPLLGVMGFYKLFHLNLPIWKWIVIVLISLITPLILQYFFYRSFADQEVDNMYFAFKTIYTFLMPYLLIGLISSQFSKFISNLSFACLLPSIIYAFSFGEEFFSYFNISVKY